MQKAGRAQYGQPIHYTKQENKGPISAIPWREFFAGQDLPIRKWSNFRQPWSLSIKLSLTSHYWSSSVQY